MKKDKVIYNAWVQNDSGATDQAGEGTNLNELKAEVRRTYGPGWTVHIEKYVNGDNYGEVAKFTLRK